jgi:dihydropteroate synthase
MIIRQPRTASSLFDSDHRLGHGSDRHWLRPVGLTSLYSTSDNDALPLAGTGLGFNACDVLTKSGNDFTVSRWSVQDLLASAKATGADALALAEQMIAAFTTPRAPFAGLAMDMPHVMGIINVTPDSFSDGGDHAQTDIAIRAARMMADAGATILDIGGESTRPGAETVDSEEECRRILPVIHALSQQNYVVSADTRNTNVMEKAIIKGARVINDVGGLRADGAIELVAETATPVIIMHMQGEPGSMQKQPEYDFVPADIYDWLESRINLAVSRGIKKENIAIDFGFGFGKTPEHNMVLMAWLSMFHGLGVPLLLGVSRKSTIAHFSKGESAKDRMPGSLALATLGYAQGVQMYRVHDVAETVQALAVAKAMHSCDMNMFKT